MKDNPLFYTVSMAKLCADQGYFDRSMEIYRRLLEADAENDTLRLALTGVEQQQAALADVPMAEAEIPAAVVEERPDTEEAFQAVAEAVTDTAEDVSETAEEVYDTEEESEEIVDAVEGVVEYQAAGSDVTPAEDSLQETAGDVLDEAAVDAPVNEATTPDSAEGQPGGLEPIIKKWVELMVETDLKKKFDKIRKTVKYLQFPNNEV